MLGLVEASTSTAAPPSLSSSSTRNPAKEEGSSTLSSSTVPEQWLNKMLILAEEKLKPGGARAEVPEMVCVEDGASQLTQKMAMTALGGMGLDRVALAKHGLPSHVIVRVYRSLFVYSAG
jgi:hypothetical protein